MDGDGAAAYNPRTVEEVFLDFKGRRSGMIKALTNGSVTQFLHFISISFLGFLCWLVSLIVVLFFFLPDVEDFFQQCDPGEVLFFNVSFIIILLPFTG